MHEVELTDDIMRNASLQPSNQPDLEGIYLQVLDIIGKLSRDSLDEGGGERVWHGQRDLVTILNL